MIMDNKITPEKANQLLNCYSQTEKRTGQMIKLFSLGAKYGKRTMKQITEKALIGESSRIDLGGEDEVEQIFCDEQQKNITRSECLDYSGEADNQENCQDCKHFALTRKLLLPPAQIGMVGKG